MADKRWMTVQHPKNHHDASQIPGIIPSSRWRSCWLAFKGQRLALISLILLIIITTISLLAPIIANDKPLIVRYAGSWYLPTLVDYPETAFGGEFKTSAVYSDPYLIDLINKNGWMLHAPIRYGEHSLVMDAAMPHPAPPSAGHWLGTDDVGRDVLARVLYGLRVSLIFGFMLSIACALIGLFIGSLMGYFAGLTDLLGQRLLELWVGLPQLFLLMIVASVFAPSVWVLFMLMLIFSWMMLVPQVRVQILALRRMPYVRAAQSLGVHPLQIIARHIIAQVVMVALAQLPFMMVAHISALATLDFLGLGLPVGSASLGELLLQAKNHLDAPHLALTGFTALALLLSLLIIIGEGLRDALSAYLLTAKQDKGKHHAD